MINTLWIGDAACDSGFSRATHEILACAPSARSVSVIGVNYRGDPHPYPYRIFPAFVPGCSDFIGTDRISELVEQIKPDLVVIQNDPWNFPRYMKALASFKLPTIGIVAVDGKNCAGHLLNDLDSAIFWTKFGFREAVAGGFTGRGSVIPLGVDLQVYYPMDRIAARKELELPEQYHDVYIVGNVNRNQPRKRLDLTVAYFCEWVKDYHIPDAYLFLHIAPTGEAGYNCTQLMKYYGLNKRLIRSDPGIWNGVSEGEMRVRYNVLDVMITTTQGEGFGLTTLEGMACGIPQIVPDWSALGEWTERSAYRVTCTTQIATPGSHNPIGGIMDRQTGVATLDALYGSPTARQEIARRGLRLAALPPYRWANIGKAVFQEIERTFSSPKLASQTA